MSNKPITVLAIETSCDETGVAIVQKEGESISVLADAVASQIDIHAATGGVVPEVAAREHVTVLQPMIGEVMAKSGVKKESIDGIAVTVGPGLIPALAVGVQAARTLSFVWQKPLIPIHHIEGHIYSALLHSAENSKSETLSSKKASLNFPALALIVSGGHTLLIEVGGHLQYKVIGTTLDDAAGEAFDKVARLIWLPYPGGPAIGKVAQTGDREAFQFPRPMTTSGDHNFSFSGLKTAVLYAWKKIPASEQLATQADIAASFEAAIVGTLVTKTEQVINKKTYTFLLLGGGVAANTYLQESIQTMTAKHDLRVLIAPHNLFGDNAAMIGQVGVFAYEAGRKISWQEIDAKAHFSIEEYSLKS